MAAEYGGNIAVPGGQIGSGEAQVFNPGQTLQLLGRMEDRADQQAKLEALERIKQQEAAKKAEKPIEYPEFDVKGKGGLFDMKFAERRAARHSEGINAFSKVGNDPQKAALLVSEIKNRDAGESAMLEAQKERFYKTSEELQKQGYNFDPDREAFEITQTSDLFDPTLNSRLIEKVKTSPRNFNFSQVGTEAEKLAGGVQEGTILADGSKSERKRAKFMRPSKANPYIDEISISDAIPILLQTPAGREQFPILVNQSLKKQGVDPTVIDGKDIAQLTDFQKKALMRAQKEAVEPYFKGRGDYSFVEDFSTDQGRATRQERGKRLADNTVGQPTVNAVGIKSADGAISEAYLKNSVFMNTQKPVTLPAGAVVYPTGYYSDNEQVTAGNITGTNAKILKQNVTGKTFIEASGVPVTLEKVTLPNGKVIEKGRVIDEAINNPEILKAIPQSLYVKRSGYFASPDDTQIESFIDQNDNEAFRRKGPNSTSLLGTVFIPLESAGSIRTHFNRYFGKSSGPKRSATKKY